MKLSRPLIVHSMVATLDVGEFLGWSWPEREKNKINVVVHPVLLIDGLTIHLLALCPVINTAPPVVSKCYSTPSSWASSHGTNIFLQLVVLGTVPRREHLTGRAPTASSTPPSNLGNELLIVKTSASLLVILTMLYCTSSSHPVETCNDI